MDTDQGETQLATVHFPTTTAVAKHRVSSMKPSRTSALQPKTVKPEHPLQWLAEPLLDEPTLVLKSWFGGRMISHHGLHCLFLGAWRDPWQGVLVCTFHEHQASLRADIPALVQHPILGKWLYLAESSETFERDARRLVQLVRARDPRVGIPPSPKKPRAAKKVRFGDKL